MFGVCICICACEVCEVAVLCILDCRLIIEIRVKRGAPVGGAWRDREESERDGNANARATPTARSRGDGPRAPPRAAGSG